MFSLCLLEESILILRQTLRSFRSVATAGLLVLLLQHLVEEVNLLSPTHLGLLATFCLRQQLLLQSGDPRLHHEVLVLLQRRERGQARRFGTMAFLVFPFLVLLVLVLLVLVLLVLLVLGFFVFSFLVVFLLSA